MDASFIQQVILPVVFAVVGIELICALIELIRFLRKARETVDTLEGEVRPVISDVKEIVENLKPASEKIDPLAERVSLAVDAANLEIMRLDGILENVDSLTSSASSAASAMDTVANTPLKLMNTAADKLRGAFSQKKASDASVSLGAAAEASEEFVQRLKDASSGFAVPDDASDMQAASASAQEQQPAADAAASMQMSGQSEQKENTAQSQDAQADKQDEIANKGYYTYGQ